MHLYVQHVIGALQMHCMMMMMIIIIMTNTFLT